MLDRPEMESPGSPRPMLTAFRTAGLLLAACTVATQLGYRWTSNVPRRHIGNRAPTIPAEYQIAPHVLDLVEQHDGGVIDYAPARTDLTKLCIALALAFPDARIAFVSQNRARNRRIYEALIAQDIPATLVDNKSYCEEPPQRVVTTYAGLGTMCLDVDKLQVVITLDVAESVSREGQAALEAPERARLFALAPFGQGYSPSEHDRICATFGFDHASLPAHGRSCRQIDAVFVYMGKPSKTMIHNLQQSLRFLHLNDRRNRRLAQVANALAAGNRSRLGELIGNLPDWVSGPLRTLVVAAGPEQAAIIARRLPSWPVIVGAGYSETLQISGCADPLEGRSQNACTSLPAIVTEDAFKRLNLDAIGVDAIVWAAAGKHGMNMPPERLTCAGDVDHRLLLVDAEDRFGLPGRWSQARRRAYKRADWLATTPSVANRRMQRFLQSRPRGARV